MKKFLVVNTSFFGDILLTGPLCRNIKLAFPDSRTIFIANSPFVDAARYLSGVDEALAYDKKGAHRGITGILKFYREHRSKFVGGFDASFVLYGNERGIILSRLFGAKKIYSENGGPIKFMLDNKKIRYSDLTSVQESNCLLLEQYTGSSVRTLPMLYEPPQAAADAAAALLKSSGIGPGDKYVCLCTVSKRIEKDMPLDTCAELIQKLQHADYRVLFLGAGERSAEYSRRLKKLVSDYLDLTDKTSIPQLAAVLKRSAALISVDTGTMHLGLALNIPVVSLFYIDDEKHIGKWAPAAGLYKSILLKSTECSAARIFDSAQKLTASASPA